MESVYHFSYLKEDSDSIVALNSNAGDTALLQATRDLFEKYTNVKYWKNKWLLNEVDSERLDDLNNNSKAVLIGGGGLFLKDQAGADVSKSGWSWNCSIEMLKRIKVPIIFFAVGYNRFRNQEDFDPIFGEFMSVLIGKSLFFSLRNNGSVNAIKNYIKDDVIKEKINLQPCPTTVSWYIYKDLIERINKSKKRECKKAMAVNLAYDRKEFRFIGKEKQIENSIARVVKKYSETGWNITIICHKPQDAEIESSFKKNGIKYDLVDISESIPEEIIKFYMGMDLVVGGRGHAQMIPFGLRRNIVSLVSHYKLKWFLEDVGHSEWGVDVLDDNLEGKLEYMIQKFGIKEYELTNNNIVEAQNKLWEITLNNMSKISKMI
ncbi:MAG: polysaccharide pyruvyl transferase family protein [Candidatus Shapirobacteria bacterium]|nr:polysaccharide pyruvyl transferase family protein [Candidatus Shapirobacteria bacterium]